MNKKKTVNKTKSEAADPNEEMRTKMRKGGEEREGEEEEAL